MTEDGVPPHRFVHTAYHQRHHTSWTFQCRRDPQEPLHRDPQVSLQPTGLTTAIRPGTACMLDKIVGTPSSVGAVTRGSILTQNTSARVTAGRAEGCVKAIDGGYYGRTLIVKTDNCLCAHATGSLTDLQKASACMTRWRPVAEFRVNTTPLIVSVCRRYDLYHLGIGVDQQQRNFGSSALDCGLHPMPHSSAHQELTIPLVDASPRRPLSSLASCHQVRDHNPLYHHFATSCSCLRPAADHKNRHVPSQMRVHVIALRSSSPLSSR